MENDPIETVLRENFPHFIESDLRQKIVEIGTFVQVPEGLVIMDIGQYIKSIPLVVNGALKIMREDAEGHEIFLYYIDKGQTCAVCLSCCIASNKSQIKAIAEEPTEIILIPSQYLDKWIGEHSSWRNFVLNTYFERFGEMLNAIDSIAFLKMDERLEKYLKEKAIVHKTKEIHATHQEIAQELNTSREVISRLLKKLERLDKIQLGRNRIILKSAPAFD